jgi:hypothetical protein
MTDIRETVTRTQSDQVQTEQPSVLQETRHIQTVESVDPKTTTRNIFCDLPEQMHQAVL